MSTLNEISQGLADNVRQSNNHNLKQRIKGMFKNYIAERIRQDVEKNGGQQEYTIAYEVSLELVDISESCSLTTTCYKLRSTVKIVMPVPLKGRPSWSFVGSVDRKVPFTYCSIEDVDDLKELKYMKSVIFYDVTGGYLHILNNTKLTKCLMEAYYTSPELLVCTTGTCYTDDMEYPAPTHMIESVKTQIHKELMLLEEVKEVTINTNDQRA